MNILEVRNLSITFGNIRAVGDVSLKVVRGQILSIIGQNGAGKTSLFNLISGLYRPDRGSIHIAGENVTGLGPSALARRGLSRTFQNLQVFTRMSVLENVMTGRHLRENRGILSHLLHLPGTVAQEARTRDYAMACLARLHLKADADRPAGALSYGAMKRLEIARALATEPSVLLLDEPAAGCNAAETEEIDRLLVEIADDGIAIVLIEHDMKLVMGISNRVLVLDQGRALAEGAPAEVACDPKVIAAYLGASPPATVESRAYA